MLCWIKENRKYAPRWSVASTQITSVPTMPPCQKFTWNPSLMTITIHEISHAKLFAVPLAMISARNAWPVRSKLVLVASDPICSYSSTFDSFSDALIASAKLPLVASDPICAHSSAFDSFSDALIASAVVSATTALCIARSALRSNLWALSLLSLAMFAACCAAPDASRNLNSSKSGPPNWSPLFLWNPSSW